MKSIYKYILKPGRNEWLLTGQMFPLHVGYQEGEIILWGVFDSSASPHKYSFMVYVTGEGIDNSPKKHIGTVQIPNADYRELVYHVFEDTP